jgi:hypothetical protein
LGIPQLKKLISIAENELKKKREKKKNEKDENDEENNKIKNKTNDSDKKRMEEKNDKNCGTNNRGNPEKYETDKTQQKTWKKQEVELINSSVKKSEKNKSIENDGGVPKKNNKTNPPKVDNVSKPLEDTGEKRNSIEPSIEKDVSRSKNPKLGTAATVTEPKKNVCKEIGGGEEGNKNEVVPNSGEGNEQDEMLKTINVPDVSVVKKKRKREKTEDEKEDVVKSNKIRFSYSGSENVEKEKKTESNKKAWFTLGDEENKKTENDIAIVKTKKKKTIIKSFFISIFFFFFELTLSFL